MPHRYPLEGEEGLQGVEVLALLSVEGLRHQVPPGHPAHVVELCREVRADVSRLVELPLLARSGRPVAMSARTGRAAKPAGCTVP
ncbi:hypothetical protein ACFYYN_14475 [Streptomyces sp. NPDC001902]